MITTFENIKQLTIGIFISLMVLILASCDPKEENELLPPPNTIAAMKSITVNVKYIDYTFTFVEGGDSVATVTLPIGTIAPTTIGVKSVSLADGAYGVMKGQVLNVSSGVVAIPVKSEDGKVTKNYSINFVLATSEVSNIQYLSMKVNTTDYVIRFKTGTTLKSDTTINLALNVSIPKTVLVNQITLSTGATGVVDGQEIPVVNSKVVFPISTTTNGITTTNIYTVTLLETFLIGSVTYHGVNIGNQVWSVENLRVTKLNDSTAIRNPKNGTEWKNMADTAAYCAYNFTASNSTTYGYLYNWHAVNSGKLAPAGWHIPTDEEWTTMQNWLIANGYNYDSKDLTSNSIGKSLAFSANWLATTLDGAVGNTKVVLNNLSGFSAKGGGAQPYMGTTPTNLTYGAYWWTKTEASSSTASCRGLYYSYPNLLKLDSDKRTGYSIRLVKD